MRPKKARGDGTVEDAGRYETHGDKKRVSVVALAISSADPGSAASGPAADSACAAIAAAAAKQINTRCLCSMSLRRHSKWRALGAAKSTTASGATNTSKRAAPRRAQRHLGRLGAARRQRC